MKYLALGLLLTLTCGIGRAQLTSTTGDVITIGNQMRNTCNPGMHWETVKNRDGTYLWRCIKDVSGSQLAVQTTGIFDTGASTTGGGVQAFWTDDDGRVYSNWIWTSPGLGSYAKTRVYHAKHHVRIPEDAPFMFWGKP